MLEVRAVTFAYRRGGEELFGGLSWSFAGGALTAVTGPSGRGKSTLLYLLGLMLRPTGGQVLLQGERVDALPHVRRAAVRAHRVGFVFQDAALDPARRIVDSVVEPALYAGCRRGEVVGRARELLDQLGVGQRADHRPGEISGGQAQRVAVARALINTPVVILADEPTGNLDQGNAAVVLGALRDAARAGAAVIIATHDADVLGACDERVVL